MRFSTSLLALSLPLCLLADEECKTTAQPYRITLRNIEGNGIGYNTGYTTLELFSSIPSQVPTSFIPFLDLRFHMLNNGKPACNAGLGMRFLSSSWAWGVNTYYDYRKTSWQHYNQISLGLEALGKVWDFRLNAYLPVGAKHSSLRDAKFSHFHGNSMILSQKREFAMKGLCAEAGIHIKKMKHASFYGAFGPYYFAGLNKNAIGGEARLNGTFFEHIKAEISSSYDNIFHGIIQGQLSLIFPMGPKKALKNKPNRSCSRETRLRERALQPVDRNELIVIDKKQEHQTATNPNTGLPYNFIFVDNTSHSLGTYESPYPTLAQAESTSKPHDIIYIFPGDGTTTGYDTGFHMQDHQKLLGSGVAHAIETGQGTVSIPQMTQAFPHVILATSPGSHRGIVNMGNHCKVSGLLLTTSSSPYLYSAIFASLVTQPTILYNIVQGPFAVAGIYLPSCDDSCFVAGNTISGAPNEGIYINSSPENIWANIADNTINNINGSGIVLFTTSGNLSATITNNRVSHTRYDGISLVTDGSISHVTLAGNQISSAGQTCINFGKISGGTKSIDNINIINNCVNDIVLTSSSLSHVTIASNQITTGSISLKGNLSYALVANNQFSAPQDADRIDAPFIKLYCSGTPNEPSCTVITGNTANGFLNTSVIAWKDTGTARSLTLQGNTFHVACPPGSGLIDLSQGSSTDCAVIAGNVLHNPTDQLSVHAGNSNIPLFFNSNVGDTTISGIYTPLQSNTCHCE